MLAYWNSVDLRFRLLEAPKVRLNIAGIVIATVSVLHWKNLGLLNIIELSRNLSQDPNVFSFFTANNVTADKIHSESTIRSFSKYMYQVKTTFPFDSYDIAIAMTS